MASSYLHSRTFDDDFDSGASSSSDDDDKPIGGGVASRRAVSHGAISAAYSLAGPSSSAPSAMPFAAAAPTGVHAVFSQYSSTPRATAAGGGGASARSNGASSTGSGVRGGVTLLGFEVDSDDEGDGDAAQAARIAQFDAGLLRSSTGIAGGGAGGAHAPGGSRAPSTARSDASDAPSSTAGSERDEAGYAGVRALLLRPAEPNSPAMRFYVMREKPALGIGAVTWSLYLESNDQLLCRSKKRSGKRSSNYLITLGGGASDRKSPLVVGKVRANMVGSMYLVYDHGLAPDKAPTAGGRRRELAAIAFDYDRMGPGRMAAYVPLVRGLTVTEHRPGSEAESLAHAHLEAGAAAGAAAAHDALPEAVKTAVRLTNKKPKWDDKLQGHVLNFGGRVTQASVKNFQMRCALTGDATTLQFGRVEKHRFNMDVAWPLCPLQAFGIVIASLDPKLADTKSYDALKRQMGGGSAAGHHSDSDGSDGGVRAASSASWGGGHK